MATFNDVGSGSITNFKNLLGAVTINTFNNLVRGVLFEMLSAHVNDFNLMNYDYMNLHMFRNAYEKEITLSTIGENAYSNGNSDNNATPPQNPSYIGENNYMNFVTNTRNGEKVGELTTRFQTEEGNTNYYLDLDDGVDQVRFTGSFLDRNSILYKTKKLMRQNKVKSIISKYHTDPDVKYNGQVGSKYGESHGRNLLTKNAEVRDNDYADDYGYDNPYCRVWTHQHKYGQIKNTMRAKGGGMNVWDNFEWDETDKGKYVKNTQQSNGEIYEYSWRGKRNQDRRGKNSVLDTETGLVKITPQHRNGGESNRHTKECMFSIENLAWKDYDPYSFEQALSWEQRGPLGGRIMWFPPYGLEFSEVATAKWQPNDFIGRGEPVYTYVNSERSGNFSFMMITDHPSSIDYASWWDCSNLSENSPDDSNSENDYLRYFAGCEDMNNGGKTGGLIIKPTPMTDEYIKIDQPSNSIRPTIQETPIPNNIPPSTDKNPVYVEFFLFFPNNYSGVNDKPFNNQTSSVDAISYLLMGKNAQKTNNGLDLKMDMSNITTYDPTTKDDFVGYEMSKNGITTSDCISTNNYIQGGQYLPKKEPRYDYIPHENRKWCYRIDHKQPYVGGEQDKTNLICEKLRYEDNYKDTKTYRLNLDVSSNKSVLNMATCRDNVYSFAEVVAVIYQLKDPNSAEYGITTNLNNYLTDCGINDVRVKDLEKIFNNKDLVLTKVVCDGFASSHGHTETNEKLSKNRAGTLLRWIEGQTMLNKADNVEYKIGNTQIKDVDNQDKQNVNSESAKLYRCAHCVMTFESSATQMSNSANNESGTSIRDLQDHIEYIGFSWVKHERQANGAMWNYYQRDNTVTENSKNAKIKGNQNDNCENSLWVDRGDMALIQECNLPKDGENEAIKSRFNSDTNEGDWNKLRYDQEYHFYKQWIQEHQLMYEKLQEKIKYFNPAFHSMTPEGFNARCTFLQQCTRQGNTKTMSDKGGGTANNLAFGRPPYCVLRIGDFYNQMIVIDNINFDYGVSQGIVWDLNTEGNGVQPMLCKVSISFKFIGGGDITGPVQRLQNAMSFNYYANASFYDNRADRVTYQPTNWKTMGGAGNDDINLAQSYTFTAKNYDK